MGRMRKLAGFWLLCLLQPFSVQAFVPEGPHLLDLMVRAMGWSEGVRMEVLVEIPGEDFGEKPSRVAETLFFKLPGAFRSETQDGRRLRLGTVSGDFLLILNGKNAGHPPGLEDLFYLPLLVRDRHALISLLEKQGMDLRKTGLMRYGGRICYRLGAMEGSHLLIDKETLYPLAMVLLRQEDGRLLREIVFHYRDWRVFSGAAWPMRMDVFGEERLLLQTMDVQTVTPETFSDALFSLENMRMQYPVSHRESLPETREMESLREVEEGLDRLRKRYH